jgi:zinc protease
VEAQFILPRELRERPESIAIPELSFDPPSPRIEVLENGLTVYLLEDHTVPLVSLRALVRAGDVDDPPERLGLAQLTNACMRQGGAGDLGPEQVDEVLERMAAHLAGGVTNEMSEMSINVRTTDLGRVLPIFFDLLRRPRFEERALARAIERAP